MQILLILKDIILNNKRKFKVSIAIVSHQSTKYKLTRNIISELKNYVIFPKRDFIFISGKAVSFKV